MIDLLPCPFCGTKTKRTLNAWGSTKTHATPFLAKGQHEVWVSCRKCNIVGPRWPSKIDNAERYAAEQWNTRYLVPQKRPRTKTAKAMQREANAAVAPKKKRAPAKRKVPPAALPADPVVSVGSNGEDSTAQVRLPDRLAAITDHR